MSPDDRWRLTHVVEALEAAAKFSEGRSRADLDTDQMLLFALTRAIEIVGEASSKVSAAGRKSLPKVPWAQLVGMRNRLIHAYFDINRNVLWSTVTVAMPSLLTQVNALLNE